MCNAYVDSTHILGYVLPLRSDEVAKRLRFCALRWYRRGLTLLGGRATACVTVVQIVHVVRPSILFCLQVRLRVRASHDRFVPRLCIHLDRSTTGQMICNREVLLSHVDDECDGDNQQRGHHTRRNRAQLDTVQPEHRDLRNDHAGEGEVQKCAVDLAARIRIGRVDVHELVTIRYRHEEEAEGQEEARDGGDGAVDIQHHEVEDVPGCGGGMREWAWVVQWA
mmetsp:Transcript_16776/g.46349  ORF Transcript_16776/g.46349 Transcript_16776/m.46349 type:complete len:223 (+) Transcript_16776:1033-1701(+)